MLLLKNREHSRSQRGCVEGSALKILGNNIDSRRLKLVLVVRGAEIGIDYIEIDERYLLAALRRVDCEVEREIRFPAAVMTADERYAFHRSASLRL